MKPSSSLKKKITFSLVITLLVTSLGLSIIIFFIIRNNLYSIEKKAALKSTIDESIKINQVFTSSLQVVNTISVQSEIINFLKKPLSIDPQSIEKILHHYNIDNQYSVIYLMTKEGNTLVSTDHTLLGNNFSFRNYFKSAKTGINTVDFNIGGITKEAGFYFSAPVFGQDKEVVGVIAVKLKPQIISDVFKVNNTGIHDHFTITDFLGVIIGTNDSDLKLYSGFGSLTLNDSQKKLLTIRYGSSNISSLSLDNIQKMIDSYSSPVSNTSYNSKTKSNQIIGISQISTQPFYLIYDSNTTLIDSLVGQNAIILILMTLVISGITFITLNWSVTFLLSPLSLLKKFASDISSGNFNQSINIKTNDELEDLGQVLSQMASSLKNIYQQMETIIQSKTSNLSQRIIELDNSQKAIYNLLEDVESEKKISIQQGSDLQKFKLAADTTSDQIVITDSKGVIVYANPSAEKNTGYSLHEIIGNTPKLWGGLMSVEYYKNFWLEIRDKKHSFFGEVNNKHKDGSNYVAQIEVYPILDQNKNIIFYVSIERDITKLKEIETMKNDFISVASHQLRTPLGSMRWNLELLLSGDMGKISKLVKDVIQEIYGSDLRMITLVNDLLNVSRIDQGRVENIPVNTDIIPIIEDSIKEMDFLIKKKKIKTNFEKNKLSGLTVFVDPKRFREVIQNVLSNAVKYNKDNGTITIEIAQNSNETNIKVSDTGMGISTNDQERIFTKFFRASNAVLGETEGSGLGLFVVKSFVESWGGSITFTSEENVGTTIYIKLPVKKNKNV